MNIYELWLELGRQSLACALVVSCSQNNWSCIVKPFGLFRRSKLKCFLGDIPSYFSNHGWFIWWFYVILIFSGLTNRPIWTPVAKFYDKPRLWKATQSTDLSSWQLWLGGIWYLCLSFYFLMTFRTVSPKTSRTHYSEIWLFHHRFWALLIQALKHPSVKFDKGRPFNPFPGQNSCPTLQPYESYNT